MLFGKNRGEHFPDAWIQAGRFFGKNKDKIVDSLEIHSYPILAIDEAVAFIKKHATLALEISNTQEAEHWNVSRTERWNVPVEAVREAIINSVIHSDYSQRGAPIRIAIFNDRIEIDNPGLLAFGLTLDDISSGVSKLRNRVFGRVFKELKGFVELWGSGIQRMTVSYTHLTLPTNREV